MEDGDEIEAMVEQVCHSFPHQLHTDAVSAWWWMLLKYISQQFLIACTINSEKWFWFCITRTRVYYRKTTDFVKIIDRIQRHD
jgi:hypothetical protein